MYLLLDNYDSFTYNVYQYLTEVTEDEIRVIRNNKTTVEEVENLNPAAIIISPGPGRPEDAGISVEIVRRFAGRTPILGICLGHQAIGYAFGGKIVPAGRVMHGKTDTIELDGAGLFRTITTPSIFTRYHSLVVEEATLPEELEITARSPDGEIMGIRHKKHPIEGIQFHPESVASEAGRELLKNFIVYRRKAVPHKANLETILNREDLSVEQSEDFMRELTEGSLPEAQIAAYLVGIASKRPAASEIAGCAKVLQEKRTSIDLAKPLLDTCGTGGDGMGTFNISSLAAIAAAACGATVAKHGNRAVSSLAGSADFYRELGIAIDLTPESTSKLIQETGFGFLFAPIYHGAMRFAAPVRRSLGIKTIMNLLGPLVNPAGAKYQLVGVYDGRLARTIAEAARLLGIERVLVVHGGDGLDELSVGGLSAAVYSAEGESRELEIDSRSIVGEVFGLDELAGGSGAENASMAKEIVSGGGSSAIRESVQLNAGAGLWIYGLAADIGEGYEMAKEAFSSGKVGEKLTEVVERSNELRKSES